LRKAQRELDEVIGADRLPTFEDRDSLPYMNAICKEIQRWHPVVPLGIAHGVTQDNVYNKRKCGHRKCMVESPFLCVQIADTHKSLFEREMLHDKNMYGPNTEHFEPERFLRPGVRDPSASFGFGRRICPSRHLADNTIYLAACFILKAFTISYAKDANGAEIPIEGPSTSGGIPRPEPFQCSITPREGHLMSFWSTKRN
ncbi:cytochrome P450, partial [Gautieria morchelliformis]